MGNILDQHLFEEHHHSSDFQTYREFHNLDEATAFARLLKEQEIPYLLEGTKTIIDEIIVGTGLLPTAVLKIHPENFSTVNDLIQEQLKSITFADVQDHHLNQLDTEELTAIFDQPDEWPIEDVNVARVLLQQRGIVISEQSIQEKRAAKISEIRQGKKGTTGWMLFYFLGIVIGLSISPLFLIAGIGMGYYYGYGKSVDPDGNRHYVYDTKTRQIGKLLLYVGLVVSVFVLVWVYTKN